MPRRIPWRCFHCNEVFHRRSDAARHFGPSERATPACQMDPEKVRAMEKELSRYREEDTDIHRILASLRSDHQTELRRAEERGYAAGLNDGRAMIGHNGGANPTGGGE